MATAGTGGGTTPGSGGFEGGGDRALQAAGHVYDDQPVRKSLSRQTFFLRGFSPIPRSIVLETKTMSHFPTAYLGGPEREKLSELRARTDRQIPFSTYDR